jgi:DNA-binding MarR family transcriptional regulator
VLEEQVGFILRQVNQRHTTIFAGAIGSQLTPTQWAALVKLREIGPCPQNLLGRVTAMDGATIKGVVDRLTRRRLTETTPDPRDGRRRLVALTAAGERVIQDSAARAADITEQTLAPLGASERAALLRLLKKLR